MSVYPDAIKAANALGSNLTAWFNECMKYLVGARKTFPPRPEWAERRAQSLPEDGNNRPPEDSED